MRERRPDLARVLFDPIETDRRGEVPAGQLPYFRIPVFNWYAGLLTASISAAISNRRAASRKYRL